MAIVSIAATVLTVQGDWKFLTKPFWLFSHVFAATVIISCGFLSLWQFDRLDERQEQNAVIQQRALGEPKTFAQALKEADSNYQYVALDAVFLDEDFARVVNRSQNGVAGEHVVATAEISDGTIVLVSRGFIPLNTADQALEAVPGGEVTLTGWLRATVTKETFGAQDNGVSKEVPRLDVDALKKRLPAAQAEVVAPQWLQLETLNGMQPQGLPDVVPLPTLSEGSHFSYAVQWIIFGLLGVLFYAMLLKRAAKGATHATA